MATMTGRHSAADAAVARDIAARAMMLGSLSLALHIEGLAADLMPGETVTYMGEVWGSCPLSERPRATTTAAEDRTRTSQEDPAADDIGVLAVMAGAPGATGGRLGEGPGESRRAAVAGGPTTALATSGTSVNWEAGPLPSSRT